MPGDKLNEHVDPFWPRCYIFCNEFANMYFPLSMVFQLHILDLKKHTHYKHMPLWSFMQLHLPTKLFATM